MNKLQKINQWTRKINRGTDRIGRKGIPDLKQYKRNSEDIKRIVDKWKIFVEQILVTKPQVTGMVEQNDEKPVTLS